MSGIRTSRNLLRDVDSLKRRSRRLRDDGDLAAAAEAITTAINLLEPEVDRRRREVDPGDEAAPALGELRDLAAQLADLYGSRGGIRRRGGLYEEALKSYARGRELEKSEIYRIDNTYNQVQWLTLQILQHPEQIEQHDPDLLAEIDSTLRVLETQLLTTRFGDPWALSDLGLLKMLKNDAAGANAAWDQVDALNPAPTVYRSGLSVLKDLAERLADFGPLQGAVDRFAQRARPA